MKMQRYEVTIRATQPLETVVVLDAENSREAREKAESFAYDHRRRIDWDERGPVEDVIAYSTDEVDENEPITNVRGYQPS